MSANPLSSQDPHRVMPQSSTAALGLAFLLLGLSFAPPTAAQQPADSIRRAALEGVHGPDLEGKDGPLAKAGLDLLILYHEYRAFRRQGGDTFRPSASGVRVQNGRVSVDAIATDEAEQLRADLEPLGLTDAATAGRVVSGRLPIDSIPALATVETLRGVAPSRMRTRSDRDQPAPTAFQGPSSVDTVSSDSPSSPTSTPAPSPRDSSSPPRPSSAPDSATAAEPPEARDEGWGTGTLLGVVGAAAGLLGLIFLLRR